MDDRLAFEVERFADLMVQIDDPFAEREAVFLAAGIDEDAHRNLVEAWRVRFDRDAAGSFASRFADAYADPATSTSAAEVNWSEALPHG